MGAQQAPGAADDEPEFAAPDVETARGTAALFAQISDELEPLVVYAWRRQVASALARIAADAAPEPRADWAGAASGADEPAAHEQVVTLRSVGFADLVSFTRTVRRLTERRCRCWCSGSRR
ncbi:hypothetical protein GCM10025868_35900 [Angustibacter aerolatus]|uniref:Uncharacterized protein n=1 Tax=Angustibacter aerolatus TaxID=1162965 RepID=A0ABQ6JM70_9ACTN|nr:hypothetical protein GCM10025868_35900 [Angustibacter aerolatus]